MSPARKGVRARIPCPEDCDYSKYKKGIDVRGLKQHLMSHHKYSQEAASKKFEELIGRPSMGRVSKTSKGFGAPEPEPPSQVAPTSPSDEQARAWFEMGFQMAMRLLGKKEGS